MKKLLILLVFLPIYINTFPNLGILLREKTENEATPTIALKQARTIPISK